MHPEERKRRVRHRIHQSPHQLGPGQRVVLAPERNDPHLGLVPRHPGHLVAVQPGTVHQHPPPHDVAACGPYGDPQLRPSVDALDLRAVPDLRPGRLGQLPGDPDEVTDASRPDVYGGEPAHLRFVLGDLGDAQLPYRNAVLPAALHQRVQPRQLRALRRDDQLAGDGVRDAVLRAELDHLGGAAHGVPRLQRARPVVDPAVDDPAVAPRLMPGGTRLLLQHGHPRPRRGTCDRVRRGQPDDPTTDHEHITVVSDRPHLLHLPVSIMHCATDNALKPKGAPRSDGKRGPRTQV